MSGKVVEITLLPPEFGSIGLEHKCSPASLHPVRQAIAPHFGVTGEEDPHALMRAWRPRGEDLADGHGAWERQDGALLTVLLQN